jgi:4-hydroxythreonine-4-phosphate dehydrogenase
VDVSVVDEDLRPLAITTGDPGGVGPEVSLRALQAQRGLERCVLFGDAGVLCEQARSLGIDPSSWAVLPVGADCSAVDVGVVDVGTAWGSEALRHEPTAAGGAAAIAALDAAIDAASRGWVRAIVTAPISKEAVNLAGREFIGHTEHLARAAGLRDDQVTMMFLGPRLQVALVTTHLAVAELSSAITQERVFRSIVHLSEAVLRLRRSEDDKPARLVVTGLNPHASEHGLFGDEEASAIAPAVQLARELPWLAASGLRVEGPTGAETAFREAASGQLVGVVAMMHDQATIASKLLDWTQAVNVTWGLPFVRTSVDHGVAYDAAASGTADPQGMISALAMAQRLTRLGSR